ncbi:uncharacterized protein BDZ99DRAFT_565671 [Mytilinidion resinicola]|uniref:Uncharacterized protein n=1 Tax=Mytilinidion resinicola TaxID=574789 RepID=A0A6A6Z619_9PEZI|nr:uncharacterized protein BDZ99DRAFT_565671 [Mytilinidion resinicola]KAF2815734.1 hypothetical protein BDZ99DRAFT_565671 [Mytilinidion resinicola]
MTTEPPTTHTPGIFYVASRISNPNLPVPLFTTWYNLIHIPDILKTSGIRSATRYTSLSPATAPKPYLALYPCELEFLSSKEFLTDIPFASELLKVPDENGVEGDGSSFKVADFDTRGFETLGEWSKEERKPGPSPFLATVLFNSSATSTERLAIECALHGLVPSRTRLYKLNFVWGREEKAKSEEEEKKPAGYLALHEFSEEEFSRDAFRTAQGAMNGEEVEVQGYELSFAAGEVE